MHAFTLGTTLAFVMVAVGCGDDQDLAAKLDQVVMAKATYERTTCACGGGDGCDFHDDDADEPQERQCNLDVLARDPDTGATFLDCVRKAFDAESDCLLQPGACSADSALCDDVFDVHRARCYLPAELDDALDAC